MRNNEIRNERRTDRYTGRQRKTEERKGGKREVGRNYVRDRD